MIMKKNDILIVFVLSEITALFLSFILSVNNFSLFPIWLLFIILPILAIIANFVAYFISKKIPVISQLAKYLTVGLANTLVDLGVLNLLIFLSGIAQGTAFSVFKGISFVAAVVHSYFWNKAWTFGEIKTEKTKQEFSQFFIISAIGFAINVGIASLVVNVIGTQFGISPELWATVGASIGSVIGLAWNYLGYKFIVFKKKNEQPGDLQKI